MRMIVAELDVVKPEHPMPKLPTARAVWIPRPDFKRGAEAWIESGGAHHAAFCQAVTAAEWEVFGAMAGLEVLPLSFHHGHLRVFGYRFGSLAYITDVKEIPEAAYHQLRNLDVLVLNALWWRPHPTHLSISEAIDTARALGARRTYLTHLTHETGHSELERKLPQGVFPAYDGLVVEVS